MTVKQRVKQIIKQTEKDLLKTIEQDCRLITALKTQRDKLLDACTKVARGLECLAECNQKNCPCCVCECERIIIGIVKGL